MFDGIHLAYNDYGKSSHIQDLDIWEILVNENTGIKVNDCKTATLNAMKLSLKPSQLGGYNLILKGSLHKWYNNGLNNSDQYTIEKVKKTISNLSQTFSIQANEFSIHGLEIGVNIELPFPVNTIIKNAVCFKRNPFTYINKNDLSKGIICKLTDYELKIYNKGLQSSNGQNNLIRIEIKANKMRFFNHLGIKYLSDLTDLKKSYSAVYLLLDCIENIVWTDNKAETKKMSSTEFKKWLVYSNPKFWSNLNRDKAFRCKKQLNDMLNKYGNSNTKEFLKSQIIKTWNGLFSSQKEADKSQRFHPNLRSKEADKNATVSPFIWSVKTLRKQIQTIPTKDLPFLRLKPQQKIPEKTQTENKEKTPEKRFCISCNNEITKQRKDSKFCSEKSTSKTRAKHCRNKASNKTRDFKNIIKKARKKDKLITVSYKDSEGTIYSDKLHPDDLKSPPDKWFRRIVDIIIHT